MKRLTAEGTRRRPLLLGLVAVAAGSLALTGCSVGSVVSSTGDSTNGTTLSFLVDNAPANTRIAEQLAADFHAANPNITVTVETRPGGSEGDNLIKTRLSTGDMNDVFLYNSGSLFQALNPERNLVPVTDQAWVQDLDKTFTSVVSAGSDVYGAPAGSTYAGGVFYSRPVYDKLGLQVPTTWDQFMANNAAIAAAGIAPVAQTYGDPWTSQMFVLGDFHNVAAAEPDFAAKFTANQAKFATSPAAIKGFEHLQAVHDAGYQNSDFASAKFADGLHLVASGQAAHYPMLSSAITTAIKADPNAAQDLGWFALPGDDAATNGATVWMPNGVYIPKTTEGAQLEAAKKFLSFVASPAGCAAETTATSPTGPYAVNGCTLPDDVPQAVTDVNAYFEKGATSPALEFLSPVKGPALQQITVEVGSGIRSAQDGAALYDEDVRKQAQQLGLEGW
jgi:raffinose/stachyose/melibiose transport system substrate-binding protein